MKHAVELPSQELLLNRLDYNPDTGVLTWRERPLSEFKNKRLQNSWNSRYSGTNAGWIGGNSYINITLNKKSYLAHRIIYKIIHGADPLVDIDHIDGIKINNKKDNLRDATNSQNKYNTRKYKNNKSGFKGVYFNSRENKFIASIWIDGKAKRLGRFNTPELAYNEYCNAAKKFHGEFANY